MTGSLRALRMATWLAQGAMALAAVTSLALAAIYENGAAVATELTGVSALGYRWFGPPTCTPVVVPYDAVDFGWMPFRLWWGFWIATAVSWLLLGRGPREIWSRIQLERAALDFHLRTAHALVTVVTIGLFAVTVRGTSEIHRERARRLRA